MEPKPLINPIVRYAVHPADVGRIAYIDGMPEAWPKTLPKEGDVFTAAFLVDPTTRQPVPIRVAEIRVLWEGTRHVVAVLVSREH